MPGNRPVFCRGLTVLPGEDPFPLRSFSLPSLKRSDEARPLSPRPPTLTCSLQKCPLIFMPPNCSLQNTFSNIYFGFSNVN